MSRHDAIYLITPLANHFPVDEQADYFGVDAGFLRILEQGLPLSGALGDFDSLEGEPIPADAIVLPVAKDETDSELAMKYAVEAGYSTIVLWGGLSGRLDHTLANIRLIVWKYPQVQLMDEHQKAMTLLPGTYSIAPDYRHLSLFAMEPSVISEHNVAFELDHASVDEKDMFTTSNAFRTGPAEITVHSGRVLCVLSSLV